MPRPGWQDRATRLLRHDLTLLGVVALLVAVSAGAITASVLESRTEKRIANLPGGPFEEDLATYERPVELVRIVASPVYVHTEHMQTAQVQTEYAQAEPVQAVYMPPDTIRGEIRPGDTLGTLR